MKLSPDIFAAILLPAGAYPASRWLSPVYRSQNVPYSIPRPTLSQFVVTKCIAIVVLSGLCAYGVDKVAKFEVASIKPSPPGGTRSGPFPQAYCGPPFGATPSTQQLRLLNCTVRDFVGYGWSPRSFALVLPSDQPWMSSEKYDITAKSSAPVSPSDLFRMVGPLLEERFKLKWHREKREMPVYYLSVTKGGLKLPVTKPGSCTAWDKKGPPPPPMPGNPPTCDYLLMPQTRDGLGAGLDGAGVPLSSLAARLTDILRRSVIDQTGSTGVFDVHFQFARDVSPPVGAAEQPGQLATELPDLFTAIRKLGLNIVAGKGPVEVFVVDSAQRPSEN